jgi:hypothetical protein
LYPIEKLGVSFPAGLPASLGAFAEAGSNRADVLAGGLTFFGSIASTTADAFEPLDQPGLHRASDVVAVAAIVVGGSASFVGPQAGFKERFIELRQR